MIVAGGGIAGMTCAIELAREGAKVLLLETRKKLGGRATSHTDQKTGETIDNCQHVLMRCCTSLLELYEQLGVADRMVWHRDFTFVHGDGTRAELGAGWLPAPLHFAGAFARFKGLSLGDKFAIGRAMAAIRFMSRPKRDALDAVSFADWLQQHRQPARAIERFWEVTVVSACNESLDRVAAGYALQVFQEGFLENKTNYEMGLSDVPLAELYDPAVQTIEAAGGRLVTASVKSLDYDAEVKHIRAAVLNDGTRLEADAFISALPFDVLDRVADEAGKADDPRLQRLGEIGVSPIVGLHLWIKSSADAANGTEVSEGVMTVPHVVLTGSPIQWVFDQGTDADGVQHLHGVVSAAHDMVDTPNAEIIDLAMNELRRFVPGCADAELVKGRVIKERRATFGCVPGIDALRPTADGGIKNLLLAGDGCATGGPATMEGAARSGCAAADAALNPRHSPPALAVVGQFE